MRSVLRCRRPAPSLGFIALAATVLIAGTGCGSRASDQQIAEAIRGPAVAAGTNSVALAPDPVAAGVAGSVASAGTPALGSASGGAPTSTLTSGATTEGANNAAGRATASAPKGASASGAGVPASGPANKSPVNIATLGSFSGVLGAMFAVAPQVVGAWVADRNAHGGLNGHPIKHIVADDGGDPTTGLTLARRLVENDKILAMVGNVNAFGSPQLAQYLESKNVPLIGGDGTDPVWFSSPISFPIAAPVPTVIVKGLKMMLGQGASKIGILYCLEVSSICSYLNDQIKKSEVGPNVTQTYQVSMLAPSYTSQCIRMKQAGIDAVFLMLDGGAAGRAKDDCKAQGLDVRTMILATTMTKETPSIRSLSGVVVPGATVSPVTDLPAVVRYREVMRTYAPNAGLTGIAGQAWASAELLGLVGKNLPDIPTSNDFFTELWKVRKQTFGGYTTELTFKKGGFPEHGPCAFVWGIADGKFTAPQGAKPSC